MAELKVNFCHAIDCIIFDRHQLFCLTFNGKLFISSCYSFSFPPYFFVRKTLLLGERLNMPPLTHLYPSPDGFFSSLNAQRKTAVQTNIHLDQHAWCVR